MGLSFSAAHLDADGRSTDPEQEEALRDSVAILLGSLPGTQRRPPGRAESAIA
jgi:hypothetical protein